MKWYLLVLVSILALSHAMPANAEGGCPPGQYPQSGQGWRACVPTPDSQTSPGAAPRARWVDQYQAIATDGPLGILGVATGQTTDKDAIGLALADCKAKGGTQCEFEFSVRNGCLAMVVGDKMRNVDKGETKSKAEAAALKKCSSNDANCTVYYSACSLPIGI